jgi:hypothetical protein
LPPLSKMLMPTAEAIQWVEATTPKVPRISGRVVKAGIAFSEIVGDAHPVDDARQAPLLPSQ